MLGGRSDTRSLSYRTCLDVKTDRLSGSQDRCGQVLLSPLSRPCLCARLVICLPAVHSPAQSCFLHLSQISNSHPQNAVFIYVTEWNSLFSAHLLWPEFPSLVKTSSKGWVHVEEWDVQLHFDISREEIHARGKKLCKILMDLE